MSTAPGQVTAPLRVLEAEGHRREAATPPSLGPSSRGARRRLTGATVQSCTALVAYLVISLLFFGRSTIGDLQHAYVGFHHPDPPQFMWFLWWWPHAILHGLDPFVSKAVWAPSGVDLGWTTSIPGPSLLLAPITLTLGPVVAFNVAMLAAPALSSWTAFLLCRYLTRSFWPALIGGYVFGYSTYELGQMLNHVNLASTFVIPLLVLLLLKYADGVLSARRFAVLFASAVVCQFLISPELLLTTLTMLAATMVLGYCFAPPSTRPRIVRAARLATFACALAAVVVSPYLYHALVRGSPGTAVHPAAESVDLLNFLLPTQITLLGRHAGFGNLAEASGYLGLPLLLVVVSFGVARWRNRSTRLLVVTLCLACLLSLGPVLYVDHRGTVPLPWKVAGHVPLLNSILPARFMLYAFLICAVILALWLHEGPVRPRRAKYLLAAIVVASLLPNVTSTISWWHTRVVEPRFFANASYKRFVNTGQTVVVIPYAVCGASMLWQAQTDAYYRMAGGYVGTTPPEFAQLPIVQSLFSGRLIPNYESLLRSFLIAHDVRAIFVVAGTPGEWGRLFGTVSQPVLDDGVWVYRVPSKWLARNKHLAERRVANEPVPACGATL